MSRYCLPRTVRLYSVYLAKLSPVASKRILSPTREGVSNCSVAARLQSVTWNPFPKINIPCWICPRVAFSVLSKASRCWSRSLSMALTEMKSAICSISSRNSASFSRIWSFCSRLLPTKPMTPIGWSSARIGMASSISSGQCKKLGQP